MTTSALPANVAIATGAGRTGRTTVAVDDDAGVGRSRLQGDLGADFAVLPGGYLVASSASPAVAVVAAGSLDDYREAAASWPGAALVVVCPPSLAAGTAAAADLITELLGAGACDVLCASQLPELAARIKAVSRRLPVRPPAAAHDVPPPAAAHWCCPGIDLQVTVTRWNRLGVARRWAVPAAELLAWWSVGDGLGGSVELSLAATARFAGRPVAAVRSLQLTFTGARWQAERISGHGWLSGGTGREASYVAGSLRVDGGGDGLHLRLTTSVSGPSELPAVRHRGELLTIEARARLLPDQPVWQPVG